MTALTGCMPSTPRRAFCCELYGTRCTVNSAHHQAVWRLGTGLQVFACAEDGTVEAVGHRTLPLVFAVQWHPERLCAFARPRKVLLICKGYCTLYSDNIKSAEKF